MIEVEIKVKILDPELIKKKFEKNNGVYKLSLYHEDTYFNMPEGLRDFKKTDEALRLRMSSEFNKNYRSKEKIINHYITYKGKKIDNSTKTRSEIDIKIEDTDSMKKLLTKLGFQEIFTVQKERELYEFNFKNTHIKALIDYIPLLKQNFIEVECLVNSSDQIEKSREILFQFLKNFNIKKEESIRESYLELILKNLKTD
ncbi:MAG: class IV adenylate cyclase [Promethearchaeota archaeon]